RLIAVDAASGALIDTFGEKGAVTVGVPYGGTPTIYRNVAIIGAATGEVSQGPPGNPRAFDVERGIVYLPIAGPATNYYGGDRPGNNAFANSIVAVDAQTGKYLWHFQTVHHDIWDIDLPTAGALFDFVQNGRRTPAIAQVGKSSWVF